MWQRCYWEHAIRDERDYRNHMDCIHSNPVKHGYVQAAREWPHSSFHRCVERGMYPPDWAAAAEIVECHWERCALLGFGVASSQPTCYPQSALARRLSPSQSDVFLCNSAAADPSTI